MKTKRKYSLPIQKHKKKNKTRKKNKHIKITCDFESGNCKILNISTKNNKDYYVKLTKNHEPYPKHIKRKYENWFYFKVSNCKNKNITFDFKDLKYFQMNLLDILLVILMIIKYGKEHLLYQKRQYYLVIYSNKKYNMVYLLCTLQY